MSSLEAQVVGRLLDEPRHVTYCDLTPDEITTDQYRIIYRKILEFVESNQAISPFSIADALQIDTGQDWTVTCLRLAEESKGVGKLEADVELVRRNGQLHAIKQALSYALTDLENEKDPKVADRAIESLMAIGNKRRKNLYSMDEMIDSVLDHFETVNNSDEAPGIKTGLADLDEIMGGFHKTDFVIIAARPAVGKTALGLNFANAAAVKKPVLFFSGEQGHQQIGMRLFSVEGSVNSGRMRNVDFDEHEWAQVANAAQLLKGKKIYLCDEAYPSITDVVRISRQAKYEHDIQAIFVDYLQIIQSNLRYGDKKDHIGSVAIRLKALAKELDVPVIALAQVKRAVDDRTDKRPLQGDISDSSEAEKTADVIMTLYRSDVYPEDEGKPGTAEIFICKNRHGGTGIIETAFIGKFMQFKDLDYRFSEKSHYG